MGARRCRGNDDAVNLYRAFTDSVDGATLAPNGAPDVPKNTWVLETLELLNFGRPTLTAFDQNVLPATGMTLEYPQIDSNSITTATQAAESDALTYGKLTLTSATSPVITAGAWTAMSFQAAQRSNFGYVSLCLEALVNSYSDYTNKYVVDILEAGTGYGTATATGTSESWAQAIGSAAIQIYTGAKRRPEFILAAQDVWLVIAGLHDAQDRPNLAAYNPSNNSGSANLPGMTAGLFGLPVIGHRPRGRLLLHRPLPRHPDVRVERLAVPLVRPGHCPAHAGHERLRLSRVVCL